MEKYSFSILLVTLLLTSCAAPQILNMTDLNKEAQRYAAKNKNKGLVIGYVSGGETKVSGFGIKSDDDLSVPDANSIFEIGAVTEVFNAILMHRLSEEGLLDPGDCINQYLDAKMQVPDFYPMRCTDVEINPNVPDDIQFMYPHRVTSCTADFTDARCVTFCDLASHTSGLRFSGFENYRWHPQGLLSNWDSESDMKGSRFMKKMSYHAAVTTVPGKYFHYSSAGQAIVGNTLAIIARKSYPKLLEEKVLIPLGFNNTTLKDSPNLLQGHDFTGRRVSASEFDAHAPAAGLVSNVRELLDFLKMQFNPKEELLGAIERTQDIQLETHFEKNGYQVAVTNGWFVSPATRGSKDIFYWKNGGTKGFSAFIAFDKKKETAVVILSNSAESIDRIGFGLMDVLRKQGIPLAVK